MFFYAGTKVEHQSIGHYEDYCPVHRGLHGFDRQRVRSQQTVYGIGVGKNMNSGQIAVGLDSCRFVRPVDPALIDSSITEERWARRLDVEQALRTSPTTVNVDHRVMLFHETLWALEDAYAVPEKVMSRAMRRVAVPSFGSFFVLGAIGVAGAPWQIMGWLMAFVLFFGLIGVIVANQLTDSRHKRGEFSDLAANALRPLALDPASVKAELKLAKNNGSTVAQRVGKLDLSSPSSLTMPFTAPLIS